MVRILSCRSSMIAAVLAALCQLAPSAADATEKGPFTVKSGVPTIVLSYAAYDRDTCLFLALPTYRIVTPPAHGTIEIGKFAHIVDKEPCKGKSMKSNAITYRSNPGYHGSDRIVVDAESANYTDGSGHYGDRVTIDVIVK